LFLNTGLRKQVVSFFYYFFLAALSFWPNPYIKMGGADRCGILFYAGSTTTDIGLLLVAQAPILLPHKTFSI
jgi:hypothetical protein